MWYFVRTYKQLLKKTESSGWRVAEDGSPFPGDPAGARFFPFHLIEHLAVSKQKFMFVCTILLWTWRQPWKPRPGVLQWLLLFLSVHWVTYFGQQVFLFRKVKLSKTIFWGYWLANFRNLQCQPKTHSCALAEDLSLDPNTQHGWFTCLWPQL